MTLSKSKRGWVAEDLIPFNGAQKLCVETFKYDGRLITRASVNTYSATGFQHIFGLAGGGDYSERVIVSAERATEKTIAKQHAQAMQQLEQIMERARAHYAKGARS